MTERLKKLRKHFNMSQAQFGEKIGVGQQAVGKIEQGLIRLTDRNFDAICRVFKVNPEWLRTGEGEMLDTTVKSTLEELAAEYALTVDEQQVLQAYLEFPPEQRAVIAEYLKQTLIFVQKTLGDSITKEKRRRELLEQRERINMELATLDGGMSSAEESSDAAG